MFVEAPLQFIDISAKLTAFEEQFYSRAMEILDESGVPWLVGGAFALAHYSGVLRYTKDFDVMVRRDDVDRVLEAFSRAGFSAAVVFEHWIAKVHSGKSFIDVIFNSGNGLCPVDDEWIRHACPAIILKREVRLCPVEEIIWQKAFIMERERFDGADIMHLLRGCASSIDWQRLLDRFGDDGCILLAHLLIFRFVYPDLAATVPDWVFRKLQALPNPAGTKTCNGTLLSRSQYLDDIERLGYLDPRIHSRHLLTEKQADAWTAAAERQ